MTTFSLKNLLKFSCCVFLLSLWCCKDSQPKSGGNNAKTSSTPYNTYYGGVTTNPYGYNTPNPYGYVTPNPYGGGGMRITYMTNIAPIVQQYCVSCHSSMNPSGGVDLQVINSQTYPQYQSLWPRVVSAVQMGRMPKGSPLRQDLIAQFMAWQQQQPPFPYQ